MFKEFFNSLLITDKNDLGKNDETGMLSLTAIFIRIAKLDGVFDKEELQEIRNFLKIIGENTNVDLAANVLIKLYNQAVKSNNIDVGEIIGTINILKNTKIDKPKLSPSTIANNKRYTVQITSKRILKDAQIFTKSMIEKGYDAYIQKSIINNDNIWYVATGSSGVWKTVNSGTTWKPIADNMPFYSTGSITIDPSNPRQ